MSYLITCILLLTASQELPPSILDTEIGVDAVTLVGTYAGYIQDKPGETMFYLYIPNSVKGKEGIPVICFAKGKKAKRLKGGIIRGRTLVIIKGHHIWKQTPDGRKILMIQADELYIVFQPKDNNSSR